MSASYGSESASFIHIFIYVKQNAAELYFYIYQLPITTDAFCIMRVEYVFNAHSKCIFKDTQTGFIHSVLDRGLVNYNLCFCTLSTNCMLLRMTMTDEYYKLCSLFCNVVRKSVSLLSQIEFSLGAQEISLLMFFASQDMTILY